jgi:site-specific recombinase XerD
MKIIYTQQFIQFLQAKNLSASTIKHYCRYVKIFDDWSALPIENACKKDVLNFLTFLQNKKNQANITRRNNLIALHHYFDFLIQNAYCTHDPTALIHIRGTKKRALYQIFSKDELIALVDQYDHLFLKNYQEYGFSDRLAHIHLLTRERNFIMLTLLVFQGLNTNEIAPIQVKDLDLRKGTIHIVGTGKSTSRILNLDVSQVSAFYHYIHNIRPQFYEYTSVNDFLFYSLPECGKSRCTKDYMGMGALKTLSDQVKSFNKSFLNFKQVRASVITHWLKVFGLRKAQYLAGHKYISSTENYIPNQIENLQEDISKFNPY